MPIHNGLTNYDQEEFNRKSRFGISMKSVAEVEQQNSNFKIAMNFFYNSFDIEDKNIRFVLLFSSLEAIFSLKNIGRKLKFDGDTLDSEKIAKAISVLSSEFLYYDSEEETKEKEKRINLLYGKRGNYIHGNKKFEITESEEKELREYVREILIIYFLSCNGMKLKKKENMASKVLAEVHENKRYTISMKVSVDALRGKTYKESYDKSLERIKNAIIEGKLEIQKMENGCVTEVKEK